MNEKHTFHKMKDLINILENAQTHNNQTNANKTLFFYLSNCKDILNNTQCKWGYCKTNILVHRKANEHSLSGCRSILKYFFPLMRYSTLQEPVTRDTLKCRQRLMCSSGTRYWATAVQQWIYATPLNLTLESGYSVNLYYVYVTTGKRCMHKLFISISLLLMIMRV